MHLLAIYLEALSMRKIILSFFFLFNLIYSDIKQLIKLKLQHFYQPKVFWEKRNKKISLAYNQSVFHYTYNLKLYFRINFVKKYFSKIGLTKYNNSFLNYILHPSLIFQKNRDLFDNLRGNCNWSSPLIKRLI